MSLFFAYKKQTFLTKQKQKSFYIFWEIRTNTTKLQNKIHTSKNTPPITLIFATLKITNIKIKKTKSKIISKIIKILILKVSPQPYIYILNTPFPNIYNIIYIFLIYKLLFKKIKTLTSFYQKIRRCLFFGWLFLFFCVVFLRVDTNRVRSKSHHRQHQHTSYPSQCSHVPG